jgi:hypothetical protein
MENVPIEKWFGVHLDIPIIGDVKLGSRWGGAEEVENDVVTNPELFAAWLQEHGFTKQEQKKRRMEPVL